MHWLSRLLIGLIALAAFVSLCLIWSWWLTLFAVLGIIVTLVAKNFSSFGAVGVGIGTIVVLIALGQLGVLPSVTRKSTAVEAVASCSESPLQKVFAAFGINGSDQFPRRSEASAFEQRRLESERDASRYLFQARRAMEVDVTLTAVSRILDLDSAPGLEDARRAVNDGAEEIRSFLNQNKLSGAGERAAAFADIEHRIQAVLASLKGATKVGELGPINSALFEVNTTSLMSQLAQKMFSLQESLLVLTGQSVDARPSYSIEWDERQSRTVYREEIAIVSRQDGLLDTLDASLLKREADTGGLSSQLWLQLDGGTPVKIENPAQILVEPRRKSAKLIYERFGPTLDQHWCRSAPLSTIRRILFVWPASAASVRLGGVLTKGDAHLPVWFSIDRSKPESQFVEQIRLPENSVFASAKALDVRTRDGYDILTSTTQQNTSLRSFASDQNNWIEVFNDDFVLRSGVTQKFKQYLILENAISAIAVFAAGAIITLIFPKLRPQH